MWPTKDIKPEIAVANRDLGLGLRVYALGFRDYLDPNTG